MLVPPSPSHGGSSGGSSPYSTSPNLSRKNKLSKEEKKRLKDLEKQEKDRQKQEKEMEKEMKRKNEIRTKNRQKGLKTHKVSARAVLLHFSGQLWELIKPTPRV